MTKDEIIKRVEWMTTSSVELSQPIQVYNDGFKDGANFVLQNLQQAPCSTLRELLVQKLNHIQQLQFGMNAITAAKYEERESTLQSVIEMIDELQP